MAFIVSKIDGKTVFGTTGGLFSVLPLAVGEKLEFHKELSGVTRKSMRRWAVWIVSSFRFALLFRTIRR